MRYFTKPKHNLICALLLMTMAMTFSACQPKPAPTPSQDFFYWTADGVGIPTLIYKTDDEDTDGVPLVYLDVETMQTHYLCSKPNCKHTLADDCNSFKLPQATFLYQDKLYYFERKNSTTANRIEEKTTLYTADMDGNNQKELATVSGNAHTQVLISTKNNQMLFATRQYAVVVNEETGSSDMVLGDSVLYALHIDTGKLETIKSFAPFVGQNGDEKPIMVNVLGGFDDKAYVKVRSEDDAYGSYDFETKTFAEHVYPHISLVRDGYLVYADDPDSQTHYLVKQGEQPVRMPFQADFVGDFVLDNKISYASYNDDGETTTNFYYDVVTQKHYQVAPEHQKAFPYTTTQDSVVYRWNEMIGDPEDGEYQTRYEKVPKSAFFVSVD